MEKWPVCKETREFLGERGYNYTEKDVKEDLDARKELKALGKNKVPTFVIGDKVFTGLKKRKIDKLYEAL